MEIQASQLNGQQCQYLASISCVSSDTWVHTISGPKQVRELVGMTSTLLINGKCFDTNEKGFFKAATKQILLLETEDGRSIKLSHDHKVLVSGTARRFRGKTEWREAGSLRSGDKIVLNNHSEANKWQGQYSFDHGYLMGLLIGDGYMHKRMGAVICVWNNVNASGADCSEKSSIKDQALSSLTKAFKQGATFKGWNEIVSRGESRIFSMELAKFANTLGISTASKNVTAAFEKSSSGFHIGFLNGIFDADGSVVSNTIKLTHPITLNLTHPV